MREVHKMAAGPESVKHEVAGIQSSHDVCAGKAGDAFWDCIYGAPPGEGKKVKAAVDLNSDEVHKLFNGASEGKINTAYQYLMHEMHIPGYSEVPAQMDKLITPAERSTLDKFVKDNPIK
jgi:hypothetical protein